MHLVLHFILHYLVLQNHVFGQCISPDGMVSQPNYLEGDPSIQGVMLRWLKKAPQPQWNDIRGKRSGGFYLPVLADEGPCQAHSELTLTSALQAQPWALSMLDASSKPGPGLLEGRIQDLGDYDQCLRVQEPTGQFHTQHCVVEMKGILPSHVIDFFLRTGVNNTFPMGFASFAVCIPSSCSNDDLQTHVLRSLEAANISLGPEAWVDYHCSLNRPPHFRLKDKMAIAVFSTVALLVVLSSSYDWIKTGSKSELMSAFSVMKGWRELTDCSVTPTISCLDGIRLLCAFAVLVTHRLMLYFFVPYLNFQTYLQERSSLAYAIVGSGSMATETFFLVNGLTRTYSFLKARHAGKPVNHLYNSIQRYFRFTPVMALMVLFTSTLAVHVSEGPLWTRCMGFDELLCNYLWFLNLLQLGNWLIYKCRIESWFIASDFQLYLVSPLVLSPLYETPKKGFAILSIVFTTCVFAKMVTSYVSLLYPDIITNLGTSPTRNFSHAHSNTFLRTPPYIMGIVLGYLLYHHLHGKKKIILPRWTVCLGWMISSGVIISTPLLHSVYFQPDYQDDPWMSLLYVGVWEHTFAAAVGWIILACTLGYGGWVNRLLSLSGLRPLAKLSFGLYLTHMSLQAILIFRARQPLDFNTLNTLHLCCGDIVLAFLAGTVMYLAVETPCNRVVSHLLRHKLTPNKQTNKQLKKNK